ncbi:hypothetical protein [Deinococcus kurensis]|uniref:hypothetical protein n=1 Tax=Deinococcus kurensis TaxID=2662757 RepID=UPI0012D32065|nr:hypothetical protein [Deinococcus kurensis]
MRDIYRQTGPDTLNVTGVDALNTKDPRTYHVRWAVDKRNVDTGETVTDVREGNILLTVGITELLNLLAGNVATPFNNANAAIAVGNGTTAASTAQTDLTGGSKERQGMEPTYPQVSGNQITWRAKFGTAKANFQWNEYGVANSVTSGAGVLLNRKVESLGEKTASDEWTLTITITLS